MMIAKQTALSMSTRILLCPGTRPDILVALQIHILCQCECFPKYTKYMYHHQSLSNVEKHKDDIHHLLNINKTFDRAGIELL